MNERIVENTWVCTSCKSTQLGRYMKCQSCGSAKEKDEQDIVPDPASAATVTDPELLKMAKDAPDWVCEYCGGRVRNAEGKCTNCAAERASLDARIAKLEASWTPEDAEAQKRGQEEDARKIAGDWAKVLAEPPRMPPEPPKRAPPPPPPRKPVPAPKKPFPWPYVLAGIGAGLVAGLLAYLLTPREFDARISNIQWTYSSDLRQKTKEHKGEWVRPSEASAFNVSCASRYYGNEDCHPHNCNPRTENYDCNCSSYSCNCRETCSSNKNGFSTCSTSCSTCSKCSTCSRTVYSTCYDRCSVYKNWCEYDYYAWPVIAHLSKSGATHAVSWPVLEAKGTDQRLDRTEVYEVVFAKDGDTWTYSPRSLAEFEKFNESSIWRIKVRRIGTVEPLELIRETFHPR